MQTEAAGKRVSMGQTDRSWLAAAKLLVAALMAGGLAACGGPPRDPVERLLHDLSSAAEGRDAAAVGERLAEAFRGEGGMTKDEAVATVRKYLAAYDRVGVQIFDVQRPDAARLTFRVDFTGKPKEIGGLAGFLPSAAVYEFDLELAGRGDDLKVAKAAWRPWSPAASP
jgi:hypothetical protein